jgi:hypothetical protein
MHSPSLHEQYMRAVVADRVRSPAHGPPDPPGRRRRSIRLRERMAFVLAVAARRLDEPTSRRAMEVPDGS